MNTALFVVGLFVAGLGLSGVFGLVPFLSGSVVTGAITGLPSVDSVGSVSCNGCSSQSISLTTTGPGVVVVIIGETLCASGCTAPAVSSVSSPVGLTFSQRFTSTTCYFVDSEWFAVSSAAQNTQVTVTLTSGAPWNLIVFDVAGSTGFDPATTPTGHCNNNLGTLQITNPISTSGSSDLVFMADVGAAGTPNAPLTLLATTGIPSWQPMTVGATTSVGPLSGVSFGMTTPTPVLGNAFADALVIAPVSTTTTSTTSTSTTSGGQIIQPLSFPYQGTGVLAYGVTISGCNASPTYLYANGAVNNIIMNPGCTLTAVVQNGPPPATNYVWAANNLPTISITSCTSPSPCNVQAFSYITVPITTTTTSTTSTISTTTGCTSNCTTAKGFPLIGFTLFGAGIVTMIGATRMKGKHDSG